MSTATVTAVVHLAGPPVLATPVYILNTQTVSTVSTIPGSAWGSTQIFPLISSKSHSTFVISPSVSPYLNVLFIYIYYKLYWVTLLLCFPSCHFLFTITTILLIVDSAGKIIQFSHPWSVSVIKVVAVFHVFRSCRANFVKLYNSSRPQLPPVKKLCGFEENFELILESSGSGHHNLIQFR